MDCLRVHAPTLSAAAGVVTRSQNKNCTATSGVMTRAQKRRLSFKENSENEVRQSCKEPGTFLGLFPYLKTCYQNLYHTAHPESRRKQTIAVHTFSVTFSLCSVSRPYHVARAFAHSSKQKLIPLACHLDCGCARCIMNTTLSKAAYSILYILLDKANSDL